MGFIIAFISLMVLIEIAIWVSVYLEFRWQRKHIVEPIKKILNAVDNSETKKLKDLSKSLENIIDTHIKNIDVQIDIKPKEKTGEENNGF